MPKNLKYELKIKIQTLNSIIISIIRIKFKFKTIKIKTAINKTLLNKNLIKNIKNQKNYGQCLSNLCIYCI